MRLSSQSSQFVFNLPADFITPELSQTYKELLDKNWVQYSDVTSYLNSTIRSTSFPGISFPTPEQHIMRGKIRAYKPATNVQDIVSSHNLDVTFASVDADINYWILFDILIKHYLNVTELFIKPFTVICLDIHRDAIYKINFFEIIMKGLDGNKFDYSSQKVATKDFTVNFSFNFYEVDFLLNKQEILEMPGSNSLDTASPLIISNRGSINPLNSIEPL